MQLAKPFGAGRVIATASTEEKRAKALELGADAAVDPADEDLTAALIEANEGKQVDVVLEMSGGRVFDACVEALAPFGRIVAYGIAEPRAERRCETGPADAQEPRRDRLLAHALPRPPRHDGGAARATSSSARPAASCVPQWATPTRSPTCAARTRTCRAGGRSGKLLLDPPA